MKQKFRTFIFWFFFVAIPIVVFLASAFWGYYKQKWGLFGRSGAFLCVAGSAIVLRDMFLISFSEFAQRNGAFSFWDAEGPSEAQKNNARCSYYGFALATIGTLIWALGDLIGKPFSEWVM